MVFRGDFANESVFDFELENILEDHGVSWQIIGEVLAVELGTYRRCFPAQPALSAMQRHNWRKCAFLLRDLAAAANLPPFGALSQQLLDLTHRWWTARADTDIDINDIHPVAAAVYTHIKLHSERYPGPAPFQLPRPSPASPLRDRHSHSYRALLPRPYCTQPGRSNKLSQNSVVSWSQFTTSVARPHRRLGFKSSRTASPCGVAFSAVSALAPRARSLWCIGEWRSGHCRRLRPKSAIVCGVQAQLFREFHVVPLVRILDLSPDCLSTPGLMLRWLGLVFLARASSSPDFVFDPLFSLRGEVGSFSIRLWPET